MRKLNIKLNQEYCNSVEINSGKIVVFIQTHKVLKAFFDIKVDQISFHVNRSNFLKLRKSAMMIQKTWRGYQARKNYGAVSGIHRLQMVQILSIQTFSIQTVSLQVASRHLACR